MTVLQSERYRPPPEEAESCVLGGFLDSSDRQCIQRTAGGVEMTPGQMQIDRSLFQVTMTQQHLDGSQISASLEQMRREAVTQGMGMDVLMCQAGALGGVLASIPQDLGCDGTTARVPSVSRKQPVLRFAPQAAPVVAQCFEQLRCCLA